MNILDIPLWDLLVPLGIVIWFLLMRFIFPRMGIST